MKWLIVLNTVTAAAVIALTVVIIIMKRKEADLRRSIDGFLDTGAKTGFSTGSSELALLQCSVSELENRLLFEREQAAVKTRKNADFIADVSHQLKTPLAGLRLYCEMEQSAAPNSHNEKELKLIEKMEKLVYDLLRLEKLKADAYEMNFEEVRLNTLLNGVVSDLSGLFPGKVFTVTGDAVLRCDREWLGEAVSNIAKNAAEHTAPEGSVELTAETGDNAVIVRIEDDGGGVSDDLLPKLFDRFYRAENAAPGSTGIGLAISKTIIEKHHGTVTAENGARGLRFTICLPVIDANEKI